MSPTVDISFHNLNMNEEATDITEMKRVRVMKISNIEHELKRLLIIEKPVELEISEKSTLDFKN